MKSEPDCYSIDDLFRDSTTFWDGVRNYQVRNLLRDVMAVGDQALFYHSNAGRDTGAVGVMEIVGEAKPDPTQFDPKSDHPDPKANPENPRWLGVDVRFVEKFAEPVRLSEMRLDPKLDSLAILQRGSRLSVTPVSAVHFNHICSLGKT